MAFPIFDKIGGTEAALDVLAAVRGGKRPSKFVQDKWRANKRLPAHAVVTLIMECQSRGIPTGSEDLEWRDEAAA